MRTIFDLRKGREVALSQIYLICKSALTYKNLFEAIAVLISRR